MSSTGHDTPLPELRAELELVKGAANALGEPTWLLHDPLLNRFLQLDVATFETLYHWRACRAVGELMARVNASQKVLVDASGVAHLIAYLQSNRLTVEPPSQGWRHYAREHDARQHGLFGTLVHNYLFFRIPLFRPQHALERTLPMVRMLAA